MANYLSKRLISDFEFNQKLPQAKKILGDNIRERRVYCELTQDELGYITGLHRTYIGGIERGERNVSFINLLKIAKGLGCCNLDKIFDGIEL